MLEGLLVLLLLLLLFDEFDFPGIILNVRSVICILAFSTKEDSSKSETPNESKEEKGGSKRLSRSKIENKRQILLGG